MVKKHIYSAEDATQRTVKFIPFYMTFAFSLMWTMALLKNYLKASKKYADRSDEFLKLLLILIFSFPVVTLVFVRFYLLRRARNLDWVGIRKRQR